MATLFLCDILLLFFFQSILFVHEKDSHAELWEGPRTGCAVAASLFAVDEARPIDNFSNDVLRCVKVARTLSFSI